MPVRVFPPPSATNKHHGQPTNVFNAQPRALNAISCSEGVGSGRLRCGGGASGRIGARWGACELCVAGGSSSIACTGLWSESVVSGVEEKWRICVVDAGIGGGVGVSVDCGANNKGGSVNDAKSIRSVYPGSRFLSKY